MNDDQALRDFVAKYARPYDPETDDYDRPPFAADIKEGKNDPIYNAHSYHTKVPPRGIIPYILQIPSDSVVKLQATDIIDLILQLIRYPNGVHRSCRNRESRGAVLSTSEVQWATTKFDGVCKLPTPLTDSFMGYGDATLEQQFFHITVAQGEAIIEPDAMADDLAGEAVVLVAFGVSWWRHVGCLF
jgi:hypothetical protein